MIEEKPQIVVQPNRQINSMFLCLGLCMFQNINQSDVYSVSRIVVEKNKKMVDYEIPSTHTERERESIKEFAYKAAKQTENSVVHRKDLYNEL